MTRTLPTTSRLAVELAGLSLQNPLFLASGTAGYGRELDGVMDIDVLGGLVTKAVSLEPRHGAAAPRVAEFPSGMLNAIGLANPGVEEVRREHLPWLLKRVTKALARIAERSRVEAPLPRAPSPPAPNVS